jgi:SNF2 family DNA or RNA helicase
VEPAEVLNSGLLGASKSLSARASELRNPAPEAQEMLSRALRPFLLRRTKEQVAKDLPAKVEQTLFCELPPKQRSCMTSCTTTIAALSDRVSASRGSTG